MSEKTNLNEGDHSYQQRGATMSARATEAKALYEKYKNSEVKMDIFGTYIYVYPTQEQLSALREGGIDWGTHWKFGVKTLTIDNMYVFCQAMECLAKTK